MKKIPKGRLALLDFLFSLTLAIFLLALLTGFDFLTYAGFISLAGYFICFYRLRCPVCGRNLTPWLVTKAKTQPAFCPSCGFKIEVE